MFDKDGTPTTTKIEKAQGPAHFMLGEWHEYHLICKGNRISLKVDGKLVAEVEDNDPKQQDLSGRGAYIRANGSYEFRDTGSCDRVDRVIAPFVFRGGEVQLRVERLLAGDGFAGIG